MSDREFKTYTNENGGRQSAHVVTEDTAGEVATPGGTRQTVQPGQVLVESGRPGEYWVGDSNSLDGWSEESGDDSSTQEGPETSGTDFNPDDHTATEVREYLQQAREEGNREEYNRVLNAEKDGKDRSTAYSGVEYDQ